MNPVSKPSGKVEKYAIYFIQALLIVAFVASLFYVGSPWLRGWARPRFGSVGLFGHASLIIVWMLRKPKRSTFLLSALLFFSAGILNARELLLTGTVNVVANPYLDRLHSSWLWCVAPNFIAGIYLAWLAAKARPSTLRSEVGEPSAERQAVDRPL